MLLLQIFVEESRKAIVRRFPAAVKRTDTKGNVTLVPNPHPASFIAKLTQY
jgi:hypothetical protein